VSVCVCVCVCVRVCVCVCSRARERESERVHVYVCIHHTSTMMSLAIETPHAHVFQSVFVCASARVCAREKDRGEKRECLCVCSVCMYICTS